MTAEARKAARDAVRRISVLTSTSATLIDAAIDAYEAALAKTHVRVPREATPAMAEAGSLWTEGDYAPEYVGNAKKVYAAMLAAAPRVE